MSDAEIEAAARAMAQRAVGPMRDVSDVVEFGEQLQVNTPSGVAYFPRPHSAPLWALFRHAAEAAVMAAQKAKAASGEFMVFKEVEPNTPGAHLYVSDIGERWYERVGD